MNPFAPIKSLLASLKGRDHRKYLKKCAPVVAEINRIEKGYQSLSDEQLQAKTEEFKDRLQNGETLEEIELEAFAVVKNAARRICGAEVDVLGNPIAWEMVHFDVQLVGGIGLHRGMIAEMATGEGKTLVATLPVYLNALTGLGVHLVTVSHWCQSPSCFYSRHISVPRYTRSRGLQMSLCCLWRCFPWRSQHIGDRRLAQLGVQLWWAQLPVPRC